MCSVFLARRALFSSAALLLHNLLQLASILIFEVIVGQALQDKLDNTEEVLLDEAQKILDLLNLQVCRLENVRSARVIIHDGYGQNLESHLNAQLPSDLIVFNSLLELGD